MVNSIQAEIYKLTRRPYFYVFNLLCALFALLVVGCLAYVKYTAPSNQDAINFPFSLNILLMGMPVGLYLVAVGGDAVFSEQYKFNTLKNEVSYGLTRVQVYLSRLVVTLLLMIVVFVVTIGVYLLASLVLLGIPSNEMSMMSLGMTTAQSVPDDDADAGILYSGLFPPLAGRPVPGNRLLFSHSWLQHGGHRLFGTHGWCACCTEQSGQVCQSRIPLPLSPHSGLYGRSGDFCPKHGLGSDEPVLAGGSGLGGPFYRSRPVLLLPPGDQLRKEGFR